MKEIYKATIKRKGKTKDLYFQNKTLANKLINHLLNCKTCEKTKCPFYQSEFVSSETIRLFDTLPDVGNLPDDILNNLDKFLDDLIDQITKDIFTDDNSEKEIKDIFNNHYFGKKFEA